VPKIKCPECGFEFHVGEVARVVCPMCSAEVKTGIVDDPEETTADSESEE
jgi:predicted Zn-ribbon and HTH transcriptional regulator